MFFKRITNRNRDERNKSIIDYEKQQDKFQYFDNIFRTNCLIEIEKEMQTQLDLLI